MFFAEPIEPSLFNWTLEIGDFYSYRVTLLKSPDLPNWIQYLYSRIHRCGFIYGVAPKEIPNVEVLAPFFIISKSKRADFL